MMSEPALRNVEVNMNSEGSFEQLIVGKRKAKNYLMALLITSFVVLLILTC